MALTVLATIGSLGTTQTLSGTLVLPATAISATATYANFQAAVAQHIAGNPASLTALMEFSADGGVTWDAPGMDPWPVSCGRDKGYSGDTLMTLRAPIPQVGSATRMIRGSLISSGPVITAAAIQIMSGSP